MEFSFSHNPTTESSFSHNPTMEDMESSSSHNPTMESSFSHNKSITLPIPTWKMYENPLYTSNTSTATNQELHYDPHLPVPLPSASSSGIKSSNNNNNNSVIPKLHILHLPVSARKIAASFWDLSFMKMPMMESTTQMIDDLHVVLKEEMERERRWRKKAESLNKKLGRELMEERKRREALERRPGVWEQLEAGEIINSLEKEMCLLRMEMEEERKMMRMAELFREERVRMKLSEARLFMEEKHQQLDHHDRSNSSRRRSSCSRRRELWD